MSGILYDKTMDEKFMYLLKDDKQNYTFCILKSLVEKFGTNQLKFNKSTQSFSANK